MLETVTVDEAVEIAQRTFEFSRDTATTGDWVSAVALENIDHVPDDDMPSRAPGGVQVFPVVRVSAAADMRELMELVAQPGVESVAGTTGFPHVTVAAATDLAATQSYLTHLELWRGGGMLWAENGRVRLTELPESLTSAGYAAMATPAVNDYDVEFFIRVIGADGAVDTAGVLGTR